MVYYAAWFSRSLICFVFILALAGTLWSKRSRIAFRLEVANLRYLPYRASTAVAGMVVTFEAILVVLLSSQSTAVLGFLLAAGLLTAFTVYLTTADHAGRTSSCNCFGALSSSNLRNARIRNILLTMSCGIGFLTTTAAPPANYTWVGIVVAQLAAGGAIVAWYFLSAWLNAFADSSKAHIPQPKIDTESSR